MYLLLFFNVQPGRSNIMSKRSRGQVNTKILFSSQHNTISQSIWLVSPQGQGCDGYKERHTSDNGEGFIRNLFVFLMFSFFQGSETRDELNYFRRYSSENRNKGSRIQLHAPELIVYHIQFNTIYIFFYLILIFVFLIKSVEPSTLKIYALTARRQPYEGIR